MHPQLVVKSSKLSALRVGPFGESVPVGDVGEHDATERLDSRVLAVRRRGGFGVDDVDGDEVVWLLKVLPVLVADWHVGVDLLSL